MWDVWFHSQIAYSSIEHLLNINEILLNFQKFGWVWSRCWVLQPFVSLRLLLYFVAVIDAQVFNDRVIFWNYNSLDTMLKTPKSCKHRWCYYGCFCLADTILSFDLVIAWFFPFSGVNVVVDCARTALTN